MLATSATGRCRPPCMSASPPHVCAKQTSAKYTPRLPLYQAACVSGRIDLPDLSWLQHAESLCGSSFGRHRLRKRERRCVDRLVGQLKGSVMMRERELGAAVAERLHGLGRIHVLVAHEPARLVGADRQDREPERSVLFLGAAEVMSFAIA